jgi:hypothetical protein
LEGELASLDAATQRALIRQWLPQVRELRDQRKAMIRVMVCTIMAPVVVALGMIVFTVATHHLDLLTSGLAGLLLGVSSLAFIYLGKIQNCNDVLIVIEFTVFLGDRDQLLKSITNISCLGKMQDLLQDVRVLLKEIPK